MSKIHHTWLQEPQINAESVYKNILTNQMEYQKNLLTSEYQHNLIPVYDVKNITNPENHKFIYNDFYYNSGCFIIKGVYTEKIMNLFNEFCENILEESNKDENNTHPIQKGKFLINDLIYRISSYNPSLLVEIFSNSTLTTIIDILLGFGVYGSATGHWINPGGKRQKSHVDYPLHLFSSPFWNGNINNLKRFITKRQLNTVLPHHSVQVLIASDAMDETNGSTEVIPCSNTINDIDISVHNENLAKLIEPHFVNVSLNKGDILIFNRRLIHRGGENISSKRRNSLILQCVNLFAVPQEIYDYEKVLENLNGCFEFNTFSDSMREEFLHRLKQPFPKIVKNST
jgi:hypothetical protein